MIVGAVLLDFSAAFDVIHHKLLLKKLTCYLSNRTQQVFFNRGISNIRYVQWRCPSGQFLGPLLYYIFTNELPLVLHKARMTMYSDDSTLYMSSSKASALNEILKWNYSQYQNG
jgi:hypothetical protein